MALDSCHMLIIKQYGSPPKVVNTNKTATHKKTSYKYLTRRKARSWNSPGTTKAKCSIHNNKTATKSQILNSKKVT